MKVLLKIIFAPIIFVLWLFVKIASIITYLSGIVFGIISGIVVAISFVHLVIGSVSNAIIGFEQSRKKYAVLHSIAASKKKLTAQQLMH